MAKDVGGSIQSVNLNSQSFDVPGDVDAQFIASRYKSEALASTGRNIRKMTRQVAEIKNLVVFANGDELVIMKNAAEALADISMNVKLVDGTVWRTSGWFDFEEWGNTDLRVKLSLQPRTDWEKAVAP